VCAFVLVAEDDAKQAELVRRYLRREDHAVLVVSDGRAAVDQVRSRRPDLLILDLLMPELDGLDVLRTLRRDYDVPVLMVRHEVRLHERRIECTPAEFRILEALMSSPGRVFSRRQLLDRAHGPDSFVTERTADAHVKNLRRKVEADPRNPVRIQTVYGVGYKIADDVPDA
jgi:DNA-binding response OmpR family regulator